LPEQPDIPKNMAEEFMKKYPDIIVETALMTEDAVVSLEPKVASNDMPELVSVDSNAFAKDLADNGYLMDISATDAWNNMLDSMKTLWISDKGVKFGISGGACTSLIYYNKDLFAKAGITEFPKNYQDFIEVCETLKAAGITPMAIPGSQPRSLGNTQFSWSLSNFVVSSNDVLKDITNGKYEFNNPNMVNALKRFIDLPMSGYCQEGWLSTGYDEAAEIFVNGESAMILYGTWLAGLLTSPTSFEVGTAVPPWNDAEKELIPILGTETGFALGNTGTQAEKEAAVKLLEFWMGEGFYIYQNPQGNVPPFKTETIKANIVLSDKISSVMDEITAYPFTVPLAMSYIPSGIDFQKIISQLLLGEITPEQAAAEFSKQGSSIGN